MPFKVPKGILNGTLNFLKLCLIGQYVLLNSDADGNNMNKSDAIDKENNFKYTISLKRIFSVSECLCPRIQ